MKKCRMLQGLLLLFLFLSFCACRRAERAGEGTEVASSSSRAQQASTAAILAQSVKLKMHEVDIETLPDFLSQRGATLVLLSSDPFLRPLPEGIPAELDAVSDQGSEKMRRRLGRVTDPLLMPGMLISAVLEQRIFRRIVWVVPSEEEKVQIELEKFREMLLSTGRSVAAESFRRGENGALIGEIDGTPFELVHLGALPVVTEPVVLHIDLGYFSQIYKNEVKTPLLPLVGETLVRLRSTRWPLGMASFSYSNHTGQIALRTRPVGEVVKRLFAEPSLLDQKKMPDNWELWGKALYLEIFFQNAEIQKILEKMDANEPDASWTKYLLANFHYRTKNELVAERYLESAIRGDAGYALEYMELAEQARDEKKPELILKNLRKLAEALPDDPLFGLSLCEELFVQGKYDEVLVMVSKLRGLSWSPIYYPQVEAILDSFQKASSEAASR